MHRYFRTVGFSQYHSDEEVRNVLDGLQEHWGEKAQILRKNSGDTIWELKAELGPGFGVIMSGYINRIGAMVREHYMPYYDIDEITSDVYCNIERHVDDDTYSGLLDDQRVGISLIFRLSNVMDFLRRKQRVLSTEPRAVCLTAFSRNGKILLPMKKTAQQLEMAKVADKAREKLIEAARHGDESAMESLNNEDMSLYSSISKRMLKEDIYSIVDSCFMPNGMECDLYSVIGEIREITTRTNQLTGEEVYDFLIKTNDIELHVVTNKIDLQGEPAIGRRFKGVVWIQGRAIFE